MSQDVVKLKWYWVPAFAGKTPEGLLVPHKDNSPAQPLRGARELSLGSGGGLSSQRVSPQVVSLLTRFTFVFGMGTGGSTSPCHQTCWQPPGHQTYKVHALRLAP
jgi:hypothetical protein